jgi:RNA recognition motif-containing protein
LVRQYKAISLIFTGFVSFEGAESAKSAIDALNGFEVENKCLAVKIKQ